MKKILLLAMVVATFASCRKLPDFDKLSYKLLVVTNHDSTTTWSNYKTFYIADQLTVIGDDPSDTLLDAITSAPIVNAIVTNMTNRGYIRTGTTLGADLGINAAVIKITTTVVTYPPDYWWGYPGYGGCYYGYCGGYYPYYPYYGYGYSYSYTTGTLKLETADLKNVDNINHKIKMLWFNFNTGVLGTQSQNMTAGVEAVKQAYKQSQYIQTN